MSRAVALVVVVTAVVVGGAGCPFLPDHDPGAVDVDEADVLIAFGDDFDGYRDWAHVVVGNGPVIIDGVAGHDGTADRTVYVNAVPDDDADHFAVGTIIVKEGSGAEADGGTGASTHAMVKRGGGFNKDGAAGWEFFEIEQRSSGVALVWRGEHPPDGESYGCIAGDCEGAFGDCNSCHGGAGDNDFVLSSQLTLGDIDASLLAPR
jgi:hypothetical protein